MQFNNITKHPTTQALISAAVAMPLIFGAFFAMEPTVAKGQSIDRSFTITQEIGGEISFETDPNDVTMVGTVTGITGGTSNGTSTFAINTNNPAGYEVRIQFDDHPAMNQVNGTGTIPDLGLTGGSNPYLDFGATEATAVGGAAFGFAIEGPAADTFWQNNGGTCNSGAGTADGTTCWGLQDTSTGDGVMIVNKIGTAEAEEHTIHFRVQVNEAAPTLELGTYTATATLTAVEKT